VAGSLFQSSFNASIFLCYAESHALSLCGPLGITKYRNDNSSFIFSETGWISLLSKFVSNTPVKLARAAMSTSFCGIYFGFYNKYRMKGLGHRIYLHRNNFVYKLGYSHLVYKLLSLDLINSPKRFKKEYYFAVRGISNIGVQNAVNAIQSYRIPNCYCFNGIFIHRVIVEAKESKKGFML
jgi:ribosomal protein L6P/L9E